MASTACGCSRQVCACWQDGMLLRAASSSLLQGAARRSSLPKHCEMAGLGQTQHAPLCILQHRFLTNRDGMRLPVQHRPGPKPLQRRGYRPARNEERSWAEIASTCSSCLKRLLVIMQVGTKCHACIIGSSCIGQNTVGHYFVRYCVSFSDASPYLQGKAFAETITTMLRHVVGLFKCKIMLCQAMPLKWPRALPTKWQTAFEVF